MTFNGHPNNHDNNNFGYRMQNLINNLYLMQIAYLLLAAEPHGSRFNLFLIIFYFGPRNSINKSILTD